MASGAERVVTNVLSAILSGVPDGCDISHCEPFAELLAALEGFILQVLREAQPEWEHESLDGVLPVFARKTRDGEVEILGLCILISDQTLSPFHLRLELAASGEEISWLECRLGERSTLGTKSNILMWQLERRLNKLGQKLEEGMLQTPYGSSKATKRLHALRGDPAEIEWFYKVAFGERRC
jgi:hypothetical protein